MRKSSLDRHFEEPRRRPSKPARTPNWIARLQCTSRLDDTPKPNLANAMQALETAPSWESVIGLNEFSREILLMSAPPWEEEFVGPRPWTDQDFTRTARWLQVIGINIGHEVVVHAVAAVAEQNSFHPVRAYLSNLVWDGTARLDNWVVTYLGAKPSKIAQRFGALWLIGGVARIFSPGCKNDTCLILEGDQGIGKSTALRILGDPWFSDDMPELGTKDAILQTQGKWIIEFAELASLNKSQMGHVKAFLSRCVDRCRTPFGRLARDFKRQTIFAGTVNHSQYLKDETGGRRFLPIRCGNIDLKALERDKDQLWAEARVRFAGGDVWYLNDPALVREAEEEQRDRRDCDVWQPAILEWIKDKGSVSINEVLTDCLSKPIVQCTQRDKNRVGRCLSDADWKRYRDTGPGREWRYRPMS